MHLKGFLAAIGFNLLLALLVFSLWAEWGPYAWAAAGQLAVMDSYSGKLTLLVVLIVFLPPMIVVLGPVLGAGRAVWAVAFGIPVLALALHLAATGYFLVTGGSPPESASFADAVRTASFLPRSFRLDTAQLPGLDLDHAAGISTSAAAYDDDDYIPFAKTAWPEDRTPVTLQSKRIHLDKIAAGGPIEGNIRRGPLPYLVRRAWGPEAPTLGIIVAHKESVRDYWVAPAIAYVLLLLFAGWRVWRIRRAR